MIHCKMFQGISFNYMSTEVKKTRVYFPNIVIETEARIEMWVWS